MERDREWSEGVCRKILKDEGGAHYVGGRHRIGSRGRMPDDYTRAGVIFCYPPLTPPRGRQVAKIMTGRSPSDNAGEHNKGSGWTEAG